MSKFILSVDDCGYPEVSKLTKETASYDEVREHIVKNDGRVLLAIDSWHILACIVAVASYFLFAG